MATRRVRGVGCFAAALSFLVATAAFAQTFTLGGTIGSNIDVPTGSEITLVYVWTPKNQKPVAPVPNVPDNATVLDVQIDPPQLIDVQLQTQLSYLTLYHGQFEAPVMALGSSNPYPLVTSPFAGNKVAGTEWFMEFGFSSLPTKSDAKVTVNLHIYYTVPTTKPTPAPPDFAWNVPSWNMTLARGQTGGVGAQTTAIGQADLIYLTTVSSQWGPAGIAVSYTATYPGPAVIAITAGNTAFTFVYAEPTGFGIANEPIYICGVEDNNVTYPSHCFNIVLTITPTRPQVWVAAEMALN